MRKNKCDICGKESSKTKICSLCGNEACPKCWDIEYMCCDHCVDDEIKQSALDDIEEW